MTAYNLFGAASPSGFTVRSDNAFSVGTEFFVTSGVWLTGLRWHRADTASPGTVTGRVFTVDAADGTAGTAVCPETTFTVAAAVGWNTVSLAAPVRLVVGQRYRVATRATRFTQVTNHWSTGAGGAGLTSGPLSAPNQANAFGGMQGSFGSNTALAFPNSSGAPTCWFSDVVVDDVDPSGLSQRMFSGALH